MREEECAVVAAQIRSRSVLQCSDAGARHAAPPMRSALTPDCRRRLMPLLLRSPSVDVA
jgi:hypothetical protein